MLAVSLMIVFSTAVDAGTTIDSSPQPVSCVNTHFSHSGDQYWQNIILNLTNHCPDAVDLNHAVIQFKDRQPINSVWYTDHGNTAYPDIALSSTDGIYTVVLTFDKGTPWAQPKTRLEPGQTVAINYGSPGLGYTPGSAVVYSNQTLQEAGSLVVHQTMAEPVDIHQDPVITIVRESDNKIIKEVTLRWQEKMTFPELTAGDYRVIPHSAGDYLGRARPELVTVRPGEPATTDIIYQRPSRANGKIGTRIAQDVYQVTAPRFDSYSAGVAVNPLTVTRGAAESINRSRNTIGRMIGYLPLNWNNSGNNSDSIPSPEELANAGYTDIIVAFGIFSTDPDCAENQNCILLSAAGNKDIQIASGDGTVQQSLKTYIAKLHQQNINVLLSLGGATASFGTASFEQSFNQIQNGSRTFADTINAYVNSLESLIQHYGFDGFDFDVEHGFFTPPGKDLIAAGSVETCEKYFSRSLGLNPQTGSVCAATAIIKQLTRIYPQLMISLTPQTLNIAANNRVGRDALNYSSLIANVRDRLTWVGVQVYNSGGMYGPDGKIQPITADNQVNASVAMALNLLVGWKQGWPNCFIDNSPAILKPSQVVLGFPASNGFFADGRPAGNLEDIRQALSCLGQGSGCDQIAPRRPLPAPIGGVFVWNVNFDRANGFAFARGITGH